MPIANAVDDSAVVAADRRGRHVETRTLRDDRVRALPAGAGATRTLRVDHVRALPAVRAHRIASRHDLPLAHL